VEGWQQRQPIPLEKIIQPIPATVLLLLASLSSRSLVTSQFILYQDEVLVSRSSNQNTLLSVEMADLY